MRTHQEVISEAGGAHVLAQLIAENVSGEVELLRKRVWAWVRSDSIPGEYWALLADKGVATVNELAEAAEAKKLPAVAAVRRGASA
jgi:hypothetical protein